jgi:hypothetical protein
VPLKSLDAFLPDYEFVERHRVAIHAGPERIDRALRELRLEDVPVVRVLCALRGLPRRGRVLNVIGGLGSVLEDVPGEGVVLGLRGHFWRWNRKGEGPQAEAVADFRIGNGGLSTETRVHVPDPTARRKFTWYWRTIRPFSGLIRILILRATRRRAEAA